MNPKPSICDTCSEVCKATHSRGSCPLYKPLNPKPLKERMREILVKVYGYGRIDESNPKRTMQDSIEGLDQALQAILTEINNTILTEEEIAKIIQNKLGLLNEDRTIELAHAIYEAQTKKIE